MKVCWRRLKDKRDHEDESERKLLGSLNQGLSENFPNKIQLISWLKCENIRKLKVYVSTKALSNVC